MVDTLITNAIAVNGNDCAAHFFIAIDGGRIAAAAPMDSVTALPQARTTVDAAGAMVMPGMVDTHVHFREPGLESKGNIASESRAAILGGVTSYIDMPNTVPPTLTQEALYDKFVRAASSSAANYGFFPGASEHTPQLLESINPKHIPGIKLFMGTTTGAIATPAPALLDRIFRMCAERRLPVVVHAEDDAIIAANAARAAARYGSRGAVPVSEHATIRSREACLRATARAVKLATRTGTRLHIAHVSTADEVREFLQPGDPASKLITAETSPLYIDPLFGNDCHKSWRTKVNPAIKTEADARALYDALLEGRIDTIATDHAPHLAAHKQGGEFTAASGAPSLQFALPVLMEYMPASVIVRAMACNPCRIFGIEKRGTLTVGSHADITIIKKNNRPRTICDADVCTPAGWTPFDGRSVSHSVDSVWVNGTRVLAGGTLSVPQQTPAQPLAFVRKV